MKNENFGTQAKAREMWQAFTANEKFGVRVGMFPGPKMRAAELEGFNGRELCCELMAIAKENGGMRA